MQDDGALKTALELTYFAFTSLSTVGFGDYHPTNSIERLFCAFILLFGVTLFSYIMSNIIDLFSLFNKYHDDFDEGESLVKFIGTLKKFNHGNDISIKMRKKIEEFFEYKWTHELNQAFLLQSDQDILDQLPLTVQKQIFTDFLFYDFIVQFKKYFCIENTSSVHKYSFFTLKDQLYGTFIVRLLNQLEPRLEHTGTLLLNELATVDEVIFFTKGTYLVGFEINNVKMFKLEFKQHAAKPIGDYEITFNQKSKFLYRTETICEGFFIRKSNWIEVLDEVPLLSEKFKENIKKSFEKLLFKLHLLQGVEIQKLKHKGEDRLKYLPLVEDLRDFLREDSDDSFNLNLEEVEQKILKSEQHKDSMV